eukprot:CAMPEP_0178795558 /NCGR_PEP_ID=MMETSP0745-20121128/10183_1 /TAXON_ID=913974 /ORGANISM="Nitzschia punctata, Strain CCMP561" /LENGTH=228 /DNA_ID=CAMNT_0020453945 /DNA_START=1024 /DNA_END=1708 /DNA_ORIENTATION=+
MFEIRVAVIGYVSVGKTTVINALFGEEYGEVAMKRTTAVVNSFRLSSVPEDSMVVDSVINRLPASATLKETIHDNASHRNSSVVREKTFDIALEAPLHHMRADTKLVIVDIPGINEAGTSSKYKDYVSSFSDETNKLSAKFLSPLTLALSSQYTDGNWHTFDIVVVVMDARQGVNTEEQNDLLMLVQQNLSSKRVIPVVILGNKVDDPDDKEQKALLVEARKAISDLF